MDHQTHKPPNSAERGLIQQARSGDKRARNRLLTNHVDIIQTLVRRKVPWEDVEDVTQEAALIATAAFHNFRGSGSFSGWLRTITRRVIADYHQGRDLVDRDDLTEIFEVEDEAHRERDAFEVVEDQVDVEAALAHLSRHERALLQLRIEKGLSFVEVGRWIGASEGAAKMQFQRAKLKILTRRPATVTI